MATVSLMMKCRRSTTSGRINNRPVAGFSLLEVLIAVFILAVLTVAVTGIAVLGTRSAVVNEQSVVAQGIVSETLEQLRVLSYDEVGYVNPKPNQPDGLLPQTQLVGRNGQEYTVAQEIELIDDEVNGSLSEPLTEANADYKLVTITTSYQVAGGATRETVTSTLVINDT